MALGARELLTVLGAMHPRVAASSLDARLKSFQRLGFPSTLVVAGRGGRAEYGGADLFKVVWVFELLAAFVPPAQALALVANGWVGIERALAGAWLERHGRRDAVPVLVDGVGVGPRGAMGGALVPMTADDLRKWLRGEGDARSVLVVDAQRVAREFDEALGDTAGRERIEEVRSALDGWVDETRRAAR